MPGEPPPTARELKAVRGRLDPCPDPSRIRGVDKPGTTSGALDGSDEATGRVFPCEQCGADLVFDATAQSLRCTRCDFVRAVDLSGAAPVQEQDLSRALDRVARQRTTTSSLPAEEVQCESCGASVVFADNVTSKECEYCGAPRQRGGVHKAADRLPVDGVLPFKVERKQASDSMAGWVKSRWFAPNEFLRRGVEGRFSGTYLPFWTYDAMTANWYRGERGEHYTVEVERNGKKEREVRTRWYPASGSFSRFFDDVLVCATDKGLPAKVVRELEPWPLTDVVPYAQQLLAGYGAKTYDISVSDGFREAKSRMDAAIHAEACRRIGGDVQRIHDIKSRFDALTYKHLLLPVWMLTYRYHDKPYRVIVNATTGEVQGERPWSAVKIALAVIAGLLVVLAIVIAQQEGGQ
jgi:predicted RNA-binding Zn-ribbon protein involved in translation (DUF1610 family)